MRTRLNAILGLWLLLIAAMSTACKKAPDSKPQPKGLYVVCTIGMIADVAANIAGDRARVAAIMGEGVDPHLYKSSPGDIRMMEDADLILYNGLHLEGKMGDVLGELGKRKRVVAVCDKIEHSLLRTPEQFHGAPDPHVWFDVTMWMQAADRIREALTQADPAGAADYQRRATDYAARLRELHEQTLRDIATIPQGGRVLVTAHDAFGYFGRAYSIEVRAIQGISTESEASLKDMNDLVDMLVARKIKAVFVESSVPRKTIDALVEGAKSRGHDVKVGGQLFSDAMGKAGTPAGTYIGMVQANVKTIVEALK
ncbi:MAG: zinc ABC transporter substrate-binding protein [Planctomycetes bacterium]|nr:zinc ABC transporter substrate-binding protein [Planctomycetota bacterium]